MKVIKILTNEIYCIMNKLIVLWILNRQAKISLCIRFDILTSSKASLSSSSSSLKLALSSLSKCSSFFSGWCCCCCCNHFWFYSINTRRTFTACWFLYSLTDCAFLKTICCTNTTTDTFCFKLLDSSLSLSFCCMFVCFCFFFFSFSIDWTSLRISCTSMEP